MKNIDPQFTREPVSSSLGRSSAFSSNNSILDNAFPDFSYAAPMELNGNLI